MKLNHIKKLKLIKYAFLIFLVQVITLLPMEDDSETDSSIETLLEEDLPQALTLEYVNNWVLPYCTDQNYIESIYQRLYSENKQHESNLNLLSVIPIASVMGGIHYGMTLDEIEKKLYQKLSNMKEKGLLISVEDFETIKDKYFDLPSTDLTRIWGVEYLKERINQSPYLVSKYNVPDYIIVLEDPNHIKINLSFFTPLFPIPLRLENGHIYFKKIEGEPVATVNDHITVKDIGAVSGIGFDDFSKPGNIIKEFETNILYIVDTEFRSFKFPITSNIESLLNYYARRFQYLNNNMIEALYELIWPSNN